MNDNEFRLTELFEYSATELYIMRKCRSNIGFIAIKYDVMKHLKKLPEFDKEENGYMRPWDLLKELVPNRTKYTDNEQFSFHHVGRGSIGISTTIPVSDYGTFIFPYPKCINDKQMYYRYIGKTGAASALWKYGVNFIMSAKSDTKRHCSYVADFYFIYGNKVVLVSCTNYNKVVDALFTKARSSENLGLAKAYDREHPNIYHDIYGCININVL